MQLTSLTELCWSVHHGKPSQTENRESNKREISLILHTPTARYKVPKLQGCLISSDQGPEVKNQWQSHIEVRGFT